MGSETAQLARLTRQQYESNLANEGTDEAEQRNNTDCRDCARVRAWSGMIPWPMPGRLDALISFQTYAEWQAFYLLNTNLARNLAEACRMVFKTSRDLA